MSKVLLLILTIFSSYSLAVDIEKDDHGMYRAEYGGEQPVIYLVDSISQQCVIVYRYVGVAVIDCKKLSKRPEWKSIITWAEK